MLKINTYKNVAFINEKQQNLNKNSLLRTNWHSKKFKVMWYVKKKFCKPNRTLIYEIRYSRSFYVLRWLFKFLTYFTSLLVARADEKTLGIASGKNCVFYLSKNYPPKNAYWKENVFSWFSTYEYFSKFFKKYFL